MPKKYGMMLRDVLQKLKNVSKVLAASIVTAMLFALKMEIIPHGTTSQKTVIVILAAVRTLYLI
jgi:hypothetical protein